METTTTEENSSSEEVVYENTYHQGLWCHVYDDHVEINDFRSNSVISEVPAEIEGKPVTVIQERAFADLINLTQVTLPETVTSIGKYAFYDCESLKEITIPKGVTEIPYAAFDQCSALENITISDGVTSIGMYAFRCAAITEFSIPGSITFIDEYDFAHCDNLTEVIISEGVEKIENYAFYNCENLERAVIAVSVTDCTPLSAFSSCDKLTELAVPEHLRTEYPDIIITFDPNGGTGEPEPQVWHSRIPHRLEQYHPQRYYPRRTILRSKWSA